MVPSSEEDEENKNDIDDDKFLNFIDDEGTSTHFHQDHHLILSIAV